MAPNKTTNSAARKKPGSSGKGDYYHIELRAKAGYTTFRTQDVGDRGHIQRVAGRKAGGSWETVKWLIGKQDAHMRGEYLVPDSSDARELIKKLGSRPVHINGDRFKAKDGAKPVKRAGSTAARKSTTQREGR